MAEQVILQFHQRAGLAVDVESYQIQVVRAPGRGWGGPYHADSLDAGQIEVIRELYRLYLRRQQAASRHPVGPSQMEPLRAVGNVLFTSFPETVQRRLHEAQALARLQGGALELILVFEPSAQPLLGLPWELLHSPDGRFFFALSGSVTRRLSLRAAAVTARRPKAVLGIWSEPADSDSLAERRRFSPAPGHGGDIIWQEGAGTLACMERALEAGNFDAVHIVAHGRGGKEWQDFSLAFEDSDRRECWLSSDQLATFFSRFPELQFVYMDVCASGQSSDEGYGPGGLALALLQAGIPAVIVMQEDMAQRAAGLTAQHFYAALRRGDNISQALAAGRQAVRLQQDDPIHWSVPAHYSQQHAYDAAADLFLVDALLDSLERQHIRTVLIIAALLLLLAHLSYGFATVAARDFSSVSVLLVESSLLPVLGALLSRRGERQLQERFDPDSRAWLKVLQSKYFSAAVWAGLAWLGVALLLLAITWAGLWPRLALTSRQALWAVSHLWVTFAAYTGARQALRQNLLFLREGTVGSWWIGWLIMLVLLFMPLIVYGLAVQFVGLTFFNGTGGVLVVLLFLLVLAQLSGRSEFPLD